MSSTGCCERPGVAAVFRHLGRGVQTNAYPTCPFVGLSAILIGRFRTGSPSLSGRRFPYGAAASHGPIECRAVHFLQVFPQLDDVVFGVECRSRRHV
ncbi:hypothetical protein T08_470 [Trichinella sp. T8]|nr:hypothetical protein T08_470 [Trichinella sp. T8]